IPDNLTVAKSIDPSDNLQSAIDETSSNGGGVILLSAGTYRITSTIQLKDNVVLRGVSADQVIMESVIRSEEIFADKVNTFEFLDVTNAGLEHLTILYKVDNVEPIDRDGLTDGGWCWQCFVNDPDGVKNLYVRQVLIDNSSSNCWVSDCNILKSGDDPITIKGDHNTVRNSYIDRAYNKGGGGRAYFHITGDYNLIVNNTVKRLRHFAIERGAEYNVVYQNNIEVDINFHNGDDGNNLIERNIINIPTWHSWDAIVTGDPKFRHSPPGENNIILNNVINNKNENTPYSVPNTIYTLTGFQTVTRTTLPAPQCDTFYPVY
ncbi:MAG: glycosyl hydrolase family 28-related protein, partial [Bacteroidota bacterium]